MFQQKGTPNQGSDADRSESEVEDVQDPQTPKLKEKTDNQREKEQEKASRELQKQEEAREQQHKKNEKEKEQKAKEDEQANCKRREEEDKLAMVGTAASPKQKKMAVEGLQATLQRSVKVGLSKSNGKSNGK